MSLTKTEYNKIYDNVVASSKIEGLKPSAKTKALGFDYVNGKISKEELIEILLKK